MSASSENLTGRVFGYLTVQHSAGVKKRGYQKEYFWSCLCQCGRVREIERRSLLRGSTVSCGCYKIKSFVARVVQNNKKRAHAPGSSNLGVLLGRYRRNASARGYQFNLTKEVAVGLFQSNCFYCGSPPSQVVDHEHCNGTYTYNGIDRVDNQRNYDLDNCVACCQHCNRAKAQMTTEQFKVWVTKAYTHLVQKQVEFVERTYISDGEKTNALRFPTVSRMRPDKTPQECVNVRLD